MANLSKIISPAFYDIHNSIKDMEYTHFWLKGGRGSTKSSFISVEIILGIMKDPCANAIALRKVGVNLSDSVFSQLLWTIEILGVSEFWSNKKSPLEITYKPTGQKILFRGADNPQKIKSTKFKMGYCKYIWFEEATEFFGIEEIRSINQSLMRGGGWFCVFYSFNPPKSIRSWINTEVLNIREDTLIHHSTYLEVPKNWLGDAFIAEADHLKQINIDAYNHEYLGIATGTGGEVFKNITIREITDEEINSFEYIYRGLDWGYASDPLHYSVSYLDRKRRRLYIFFELRRVGLSNRDAYELIAKENKENGIIVCDSAEPKSIAEINSYGLKCIGAKKGPDSVSYGIKFLQDLEEIIIDPKRCPKTAEEFIGYELERDREGGFKAYFPDINNHSIDAIRYSLMIEKNNRERGGEKKYNFSFEKPKRDNKIRIL